MEIALRLHTREVDHLDAMVRDWNARHPAAPQTTLNHLVREIVLEYLKTAPNPRGA